MATKNWKKKFRRINGHKRLVKIRTYGGREQVRILNVTSRTDSSARRLGLHRRRHVYSTTDAGGRRRRC